MDSADIAQLLRATNSDAGATLCETHISWVILRGDFAYKIKKPVNFGFADFSSLERRRHFCHEELRLNRRFSPELYLDVVPVTQGPGGVEIDGGGPVIDFAVRMRRFDNEQLLDNIAARGSLTGDLLRAVARELAALHKQLSVCHPDPDDCEPGTPTALHRAMQQNFQQVRRYHLPDELQQPLQAVRQWWTQAYNRLQPLMAQRVQDGWVIDGHGDAHLGNIALINGAVRLFDCIEFNPSFRIMDSVAELAFLCMDLEARGHSEAANRLLTDYLEYRDDYLGLPLLRLYRCYFAMVRAKVNLLRENPGHDDISGTAGYRECRRYLSLARSCMEPNRVFLAITHGVSGSGKSTLAGKLAGQSGAVRIRSDVERKRLVGLAPEQRSTPQQASSLYTPAMSRRTFTRLQELAGAAIRAGIPAIVDATFLHRAVREDFQALAESLAAPFVIIDCIADPQQLQRRLQQRHHSGDDASEADVAVMQRQLLQLQALTPQERAFAVSMDSGEDAGELWRRLQAQIAEPSSATA